MVKAQNDITLIYTKKSNYFYYILLLHINNNNIYTIVK